MIKARIYMLVTVFSLFFSLTACGQKGSLYMPEPEEQNTETTTQTETE
ncbi:lipoprotein [Catenovulum sp. SM1970]|nr:lipoprotein [Marinifaba aquimaris]NTS76752.1 lipoprotein [Marinifaba aquimaris]